MLIPLHLTLSARDLRHLRHSQRAPLTGIDASSFLDWSRYRCLLERTLDHLAGCIGLPEIKILQEFGGSRTWQRLVCPRIKPTR